MKNSQIRVLHILQRMEAGGTQALLMNIYRNIDREKIQFDFLVEYPDKQFYDDEILSMGGKIYYTNLRNDYNLIKFGTQLKRILNENNYKIIHVHTYNIGFYALKIAKKCGVPIRIAHSHNNQTVKDKKYFLKKILQKIYAIDATDLFSCSKEAGEYLFKNKKFNILNNAIDASKFIFDNEIRKSMREELNLSDSFVVGHVGRLHAQKNHKKLLEIFKYIKNEKNNAKLILVGTGPLEDSIKQQVKELNICDDVIFLGNRSDVNRIYQAMDVFVFPSLFEGLGIVAVEAQASGIPCVCSDRLPIESKISDLYVKVPLSEDSKIWAEKVIMNSKNKLAFTNMQDNVIKSNYDIKEVAKQLEEYYTNII